MSRWRVARRSSPIAGGTSRRRHSRGRRARCWRRAGARQQPEQPYSLSPVSLETLPPEARLVLPSPNGSTLAALAAESGATVIAGCLRNARAVATAARALGQAVTVIAAGERWESSDAPLRPAMEDMVGAGAILAALRPTAPSPEAIAAIAVYAAAAAALLPFVAACSSGRELTALGYAGDVEIAAQLDASEAVPLLRDGAFRSSPPAPLVRSIAYRPRYRKITAAMERGDGGDQFAP